MKAANYKVRTDGFQVMPGEPGEILTNWTARIAVCFYLVRYLIAFSQGKSEQGNRIARICWAIGCGIYLVHVAAAFQFHHQWSHTAAFAHTLQQTKALTGFDSGVGLYFNYFFTLVWLADTLLWWSADRLRIREKTVYRWSVHGFMAFMVFNATVVFGPSGWKWVAILACILLVAAWMRGRSQLTTR